MSDSTETAARIARLVAAGVLSPADAAELARAAAILDRRRRDAPAPVAGSRPEARLARGELGGAEFLGAVRRQALLAAAVFAGVWAIVLLVVELLPSRREASVPIDVLGAGAVVIAVATAVFGALLYAAWLRPRAARLASFLAALERPLGALAAPPAGRCALCGAEHFSPALGRLTALNWRFNPGAGIAELALGLAIPAELRLCQECGTHSFDCHACDRAFPEIALGRRWSLGRWRGLSCPHCGAKLPLLQNLLTGAVLPGRSPLPPADTPATTSG